MDAERIAEELGDIDASRIEEIAEAVGLAVATRGAKRQHKEYEPDNVEVTFAASVPDGSTHEEVERVLAEFAWDSVERGHAERKESYVRKDE